MPEDEFELIVSRYYEALYRFALSLTHAEAEACDLTQQTFYTWAAKGHQLRDRSKVKSWLFTTLHRQFLGMRRRSSRFPVVEMDDVEGELPAVTPETVNALDVERVLEMLAQIKEHYRVALSLFYLEDYSYKEIAAILEVPLGTVQSRISRGLAQLQKLILTDEAATGTLVPSPADAGREHVSTPLVEPLCPISQPPMIEEKD